jgi:hypothetical protein
MFIPEKKPYVLEEPPRNTGVWIGLNVFFSIVFFDVASNNAYSLTGWTSLVLAVTSGLLAVLLIYKK